MLDVERYRRCIIDDLEYSHRRSNAERRKADNTDNNVEGGDGDNVEEVDDDERQKLTSTY
jgi:hypothetical protein